MHALVHIYLQFNDYIKENVTCSRGLLTSYKNPASSALKISHCLYPIKMFDKVCFHSSTTTTLTLASSPHIFKVARFHRFSNFRNQLFKIWKLLSPIFNPLSLAFCCKIRPYIGMFLALPSINQSKYPCLDPRISRPVYFYSCSLDIQFFHGS